MAENKVTFGLQDLHIAFVDTAAVTGLPAYEAPIAIPGAVRFTPTTVGESSTFYADNLAYFVVTSNNGYTAELELALLPDAVKVRMLGWEIDDNGALVEVADGMPEHFALLGQIQGDQKNRRFVNYDCIAARPAKELTTKAESIAVTTDVLQLTISPIEIDTKKCVKADLELSATNATAYNGFFTTVYKPTFGGA